MLVAHRNGMAVWTNPYVTDGLVAMWDGEWNAGGGVHDANATAWRDLSGKAYDFNVPTTLSWSDDALVFPPNGSKETNHLTTNHSFTQSKTIEIVGKFNTNDSSILRAGNTTTLVPHWGFSLFWDGNRLWSAGASVSNRHYFALVIKDDGWEAYCDSATKTGSNVLSSVGETYFTVGYYPGYKYALNGEVCAIRFYNRALTAAEIAAASAIDKARFNLP